MLPSEFSSSPTLPLEPRVKTFTYPVKYISIYKMEQDKLFIDFYDSPKAE